MSIDCCILGEMKKKMLQSKMLSKGEKNMADEKWKFPINIHVILVAYIRDKFFC